MVPEKEEEMLKIEGGAGLLPTHSPVAERIQTPVSISNCDWVPFCRVQHICSPPFVPLRQGGSRSCTLRKGLLRGCRTDRFRVGHGGPHGETRLAVV